MIWSKNICQLPWSLLFLCSFKSISMRPIVFWTEYPTVFSKWFSLLYYPIILILKSYVLLFIISPVTLICFLSGKSGWILATIFKIAFVISSSKYVAVSTYVLSISKRINFTVLLLKIFSIFFIVSGLKEDTNLLLLILLLPVHLQ